MTGVQTCALPIYDKKIYESDPFAKLDQIGVGKLVKMAGKLRGTYSVENPLADVEELAREMDNM